MNDPSKPITAYVNGLQFGDDAPRRYIQVMVYPTVESMRKACLARDRRRSDFHGKEFYGDALGVFQPMWSRARYVKKTKTWVDTTPRFAGVLRLVQGNVTRAIVAHEATHVALQITRMETWRVVDGGGGVANFEDSCNPHEENFANLIMDTIGALDGVLDELHESAGIVRALS